jgi:hypothetical protein
MKMNRLSFGPLLCVTIALLSACLLPHGSTSTARAEDAKGATAAAPAGPNTWHATTFVRGGMGLRVIRYWSKGDWMRAETLIGGHPIVTIVRDGEYIGYDELAGQGVRVRRAPEAIAADAKRERPFGNDLGEVQSQGAQKVEDVSLGGGEVEVWSRTDEAGRRKLWITKNEPRLPIRLETFVRAGAETITTEYSDWARGLAIPDAFFDVPANVKIENYDYAAFIEASSKGPIAPILYPDMLHGTDLP